MAEPFELTTFDGHAIGPGTTANAFLNENDDIIVAGDLAMMSRRASGPVIQGSSSPGRVIVLWSDGPDNDDPNTSAYRTTMDTWFDPERNSAGPRYLERYGSDGATLIRIPCYVTEKRFSGRGANAYVVTLFSPQPYWETTAQTPSLANPTSVTNSGTTDALPSIALTTTTHVQRRRATVSTTAGQRGRAGVPVRITIPATMTGATSSNTLALVNGSSVPTYFVSQTAIWVVVDVPGDAGSITIDIIWGAGIVNPVGHLLANTGDFKFQTNTNTAWRVDRYTPSDNPIRAGEWRPAVMGRNALAGSSFEMDDSASTSVTFRRYTDGSGRNDADCMVMSIPQTTGTTITNLTRTTTGLDANSRAFVRTRAQGTNTWADAWTTSANATVSTSITIPTNAVEIAVGIEYIGAAATTSPALQISGASAEVTVDAAYSSESIGSAENLDYYDGTVVIGGYTITFDQVLVLDGTLTLDAATGQVTSSTGEAYYGSIRGSDPSVLARLVPGANAVSETLDAGASFTISHRDSYS